MRIGGTWTDKKYPPVAIPKDNSIFAFRDSLIALGNCCRCSALIPEDASACQ